MITNIMSRVKPDLSERRIFLPGISLAIGMILGLYSCSFNQDTTQNHDRASTPAVATVTAEQSTTGAASTLNAARASQTAEFDQQETAEAQKINATLTVAYRVPTLSPTSTPDPRLPFLSGTADGDYWLLMIENVRAYNLEQLADETFLLHGAVQVAPYREVTLLLRFGKAGRIYWQKTITGFNPELVTELPGGKILLIEGNRHMVMSAAGEIQHLFENIYHQPLRKYDSK